MRWDSLGFPPPPVAAHHNILRAEEEISLIKTEMVAVVSFYLKDREILLQGIQQLHDADRSRYTTGCIFVLQFTGPKVTFPATRFVSEMLLRFDMTLVCHVV